MDEVLHYQNPRWFDLTLCGRYIRGYARADAVVTCLACATGIESY